MIIRAGGTRFDYDGSDMIAELNAGVVIGRYVFGPGSDEPLVQYDAMGTRRWLHADERGSIVALSDDAGNRTATNTYDDYGIPPVDASQASLNTGLFQYTGQMWLPELAMYNYKARIYSPTLGRFLQPDPIGYAGGINLYNYVGSDPVNRKDPSGLISICYNNGVSFQGTDPDGVGFSGVTIYINCVELNDGSRTGREANESGGGGGGDNNKQCPAVPSPGPGRT